MTSRLLLLWTAATVGATASCDPGTGGAIVDIAIEVSGDVGSRSFETATGWTVTLSAARAAVGPVYLFENGAVFARLVPVHDDRPWPLRALVPVAHAHPGHSHYHGGLAKGEWLGQSVVDALDSSASVRVEGPGTGGWARSASVHLEPPRADLPDRELLEEHHLYAEGVAKKGDMVVPFRGGLSLAAEGDQRIVQGLPLEADLADGTVITVVLHAEAWFQEANFEVLLEQPVDEDGRHEIVADSQVWRAWVLGARSVAPAGGVSSFTIRSRQESR